ncbi:hypothetical protein [Rhizobium rhizogenes]|uniref:hypothetical protein n=1 Tax=Rhizobium rhizogenes TaxID=359 RepID=UPI001571B6F2|nr:hypothetical protein [Rhizobium rhizogenes]NTI32890.1 hypothetical protein [Rhizobium rhizogenes]
MSDKKIPRPEGVGDYGPFQRTVWSVQRGAWIVFILVLLACLCGFFGRSGPLARAHVQHKDGSIEYPAISRWSAPDELTVRFSASSSDRTLMLDSRFLHIFSIESIDPPQKAISARDGHIGYVFAIDPAHPTQVTLRLQGQSPGFHQFSLGIDDDVAERSTFIFP